MYKIGVELCNVVNENPKREPKKESCKRKRGRERERGERVKG